MPPNGTSRKAPATPNSKDIKKSFVSRSTLVDSLADAEKSRVLKVKADTIKRLPKPTKPGNWDSEFKDGPTDSPSKDVKISHVPADVAKAFSAGRPLDDKAEIIKCNHCKRAILKHRARAHVEDCIAKKQEKQRKKKEAKDARDAAARRERDGGSESADDDGASISGSKTARKSDAVDGEAGKSKKRRAEDIDAGPKKKKKKDEPKAKAPRPKAPVDVEKQCGVELPQGGQCARSLTCKSHSMGAKRAVPGRSAPYDKLLAEYQRKNQAKLQKAAMESQPLLPDDELATSGPIDSDEEKDLVLAAIARSRPAPIYQPQMVPLRKKYELVRLKEMLGNALGVGGTGSLFGLAAG